MIAAGPSCWSGMECQQVVNGRALKAACQDSEAGGQIVLRRRGTVWIKDGEAADWSDGTVCDFVMPAFLVLFLLLRILFDCFRYLEFVGLEIQDSLIVAIESNEIDENLARGHAQ